MGMSRTETHLRFCLHTRFHATPFFSMARLNDKESKTVAFRCMEAFELEEAIYKGTTSLVYRALDTISKKIVVLKLYRKSKLTVLNRFQVEREIEFHSSFNHDHIIDLVCLSLAFFEASFSMQLLKIQNLSIWFKNTPKKCHSFIKNFKKAVQGDLFGILKDPAKPLTEDYVVNKILKPFLTSLHYLHSKVFFFFFARFSTSRKGIIHRDIKPENIFVTKDEIIKIAGPHKSILFETFVFQTLGCPLTILKSDL